MKPSACVFQSKISDSNIVVIMRHRTELGAPILLRHGQREVVMRSPLGDIGCWLL
jgi:hypothetical protein